MSAGDKWLTAGPWLVCGALVSILAVAAFMTDVRLWKLGWVLAAANVVLPLALIFWLMPGVSSAPHGAAGLAIAIVVLQCVWTSIAFLTGATAISLLRHKLRGIW